MTVEIKTIRVICEIDGVCDSEREVDVRLIDENRGWATTQVICKFRTGNKRHSQLPVVWKRSDGKWYVQQHTVIHNKNCRVIGWKDSPEQTNSGWTS